jgi:hypothetical protein
MNSSNQSRLNRPNGTALVVPGACATARKAHSEDAARDSLERQICSELHYQTLFDLINKHTLQSLSSTENINDFILVARRKKEFSKRKEALVQRASRKSAKYQR